MKKFCLIGLASALLLCAAASRTSSILFVDITQKAGISFVHHTGAQGKKLLPETIGAGCAFIDLDADGWADILFVNGKDWAFSGQHYYPTLYRNNHNGTFTDVTRGSGLEVEMYGMGVAVADYDNDGLPDIYITALEGDQSLPFTNRMSAQPSPSRSTNAQPAPMVSGSSFFPCAPL